MKKRESKNPSVAAVIPIRMPEDLQSRIRGLSRKNHLSDQDIMRLALERGLGVVEKMFEPAGTKAA
jgi:hypothetical protein